jgi:hypothetical protein
MTQHDGSARVPPAKSAGSPPHNVAIFAPFTSSYLKYAQAFVGSWHRSGNADIPLHVAPVNVDDACLRQLRRIPNVHVLSLRHQGTRLRDWVVCARFSIFRELLTSSAYDSILFVDIDALLRRPLRHAWRAALGDADVAIHERSEQKEPQLKVYCGHILVARTDGGVAFLDATIRQITRLGFKFFNDQHGTYLGLVEARRAGVKVQQLDARMIDVTLDPAAWIWAGKGLRGRTRWRYVRAAIGSRRHYRDLVAVTR